MKPNYFKLLKGVRGLCVMALAMTLGLPAAHAVEATLAYQWETHYPTPGIVNSYDVKVGDNYTIIGRATLNGSYLDVESLQFLVENASGTRIIMTTVDQADIPVDGTVNISEPLILPIGTTFSGGEAVVDILVRILPDPDEDAPEGTSNFETVVSGLIVLENEAPNVLFVSPSDGDVVFAGSSVEVEVSATDPDDFVSSLLIFADSQLIAVRDIQGGDAPTVTYAAPNLNDEDVQFRAIAIDTLGNVSDEATATITVVAGGGLDPASNPLLDDEAFLLDVFSRFLQREPVGGEADVYRNLLTAEATPLEGRVEMLNTLSGVTEFGFLRDTMVAFRTMLRRWPNLGEFNAAKIGSSFEAVSGDDDHGDTRSTATPVGFDSSVPGRIDFFGDVDVFTFTITQDAEVEITSTGSTSIIGILRDSAGNIIDQDLSTGVGLLLFPDDLLEPGDYFLEISDLFVFSSGASYTINFELLSGTATDPGDSGSAGSDSRLNDVVLGLFESSEFVARFGLIEDRDLIGVPLDVAWLVQTLFPGRFELPVFDPNDFDSPIYTNIAIAQTLLSNAPFTGDAVLYATALVKMDNILIGGTYYPVAVDVPNTISRDDAALLYLLLSRQRPDDAAIAGLENLSFKQKLRAFLDSDIDTNPAGTLEYYQLYAAQFPPVDTSDPSYDQYLVWALAMGLDDSNNDPNANPDEDGATNFEEFEGGTDPLVNDVPLPGPSSLGILNVSGDDYYTDGDYLYAAFPRSAAAGAAYIGEASFDGINWTSEGVEVIVNPNDVTVSISASAGANIILRVRTLFYQ